MKLNFGLDLVVLLFTYDHIFSQQIGVNDPLYLSPLIRNGQIDEALRLSNVEPFDGFNYTSFSGYITIDEATNANIYFWYFLAQNNTENSPVILWLSGGPGLSGLLSTFVETGPFYPDPDLVLRPREYNWVSKYNVVYIDSPVGTGFSFTNSTSEYATNTDEMSTQVYLFLQQFFTLFSAYSQNDFYIAAESYAGKVGVNLVRSIFQQPPTTIDLQSNFRGLICISAFLDPPTMVRSSSHLYQVGLLNENQRDYFSAQETIGLQYLSDGFIVQGTRLLTNLMLAQSSSRVFTVFRNFTGMTQYTDFLVTNVPAIVNNYQRFVVQDYVRQRLHVGNNTFNNGSLVSSYLVNDIFRSVRNELESILNDDHRVLLLSGQTDLIINPYVQRQFVSNLKWDRADQYEQSDRLVWRVNPDDEEIAGYVMQASNFVEIMVRDAGHMISYNQPRAALDAVFRFVNNRKF